jgi:hypothetical protein
MDEQDDPRAGASPRPPSPRLVALLVVLAAVGVGVISFARMRAMARAGSFTVLPARPAPEPDPTGDAAEPCRDGGAAGAR